ncbi:18131_t:CDS:2, partial [Funneliformis geosporum]
MNDISKLSTTELLKEIERRKEEVLPFKKKKTEFCTKLLKLLTDCGELDLKDKIIYEPFIGVGAMFLPLRNKGAVLIGSDIELEALEICKQLVPEAILIHHDSLGCLEPNQNIKHFQGKIEELRNKPKLTAQDIAEIERLEKKIEQEKLRTP